MERSGIKGISGRLLQERSAFAFQKASPYQCSWLWEVRETK